MTTRHRTRKRLYTSLPTSTIRDPRLTLRSVGLLAMILNLPDDWVVRADNLAASRIEGRDAVAACLRNLAECGYYRVERRRLRNGRFAMGTAISEESVPQWEEEYNEFGGKPISLVEQPDGTFKVKRKSGDLTDDGFVGEYDPKRKAFAMPGVVPGQAEHGFSGTGQNDLDSDDHGEPSETDITGPGISGSDVPASGGTGAISTTEKYPRDVNTAVPLTDENDLSLRAVGALRSVPREAPAPTANRKDPVGAEAWRTAGLLPRRYREGLPRELMFPMVHEIRLALYESYEPRAVLRYAQMCETNADYAQDKHLPLLRSALGLLRRDARLGLVCPACGVEPGDPFAVAPCHRCRPAEDLAPLDDRVEPTAEDLAEFERARAWLERDRGEPADDEHAEFAAQLAAFDDLDTQRPPGAGPQGAHRAARPQGPPDHPMPPYSGRDDDLRDASDVRDTRGEGSEQDGSADEASSG